MKSTLNAITAWLGKKMMEQTETGTKKMKKRTVQKSSASRRRGQQINSFNCGERVKIAQILGKL